MPDQKAKPEANAGNGQQIEENCKQGVGKEQGEGGGVGGWQVKPAKCNEIAFNFCNFSTTRRKTETETKTEN